MSIALQVEAIKTKASSYLYLAMTIPIIFFLLTVLSLLSSKSKTGLIGDLSFMQINIYNLWAIAVLPVAIILVISSDYRQSEKALELEHYYANNWSVRNLYIAKMFKFWLLILITQLVTFAITVVSNFLTTHTSPQMIILLLVSFVIWIGSLPLIVINMLLLRYINTITINILNIGLIFFSILKRSAFSNNFFLNPWSYGLRTNFLLRIQPNNTILEKSSELATNVNFIYYILILVTIWLILNVIIATLIDRKRW